MARGILSGMVAGTVMSGLVVGAMSVMTDIPGAGAPLATAIEVPAGSEFDQSRNDTLAELPGADAANVTGDASQVQAPEPDDLSSIGAEAMQSAALPETGSAGGAMDAPSTGDAAGGVEVGTDSPVLPSPQAMAPEAPTGEEELSISTEPAQPMQPEVPEETAVFAEPEMAMPDAAGETGAGAEPAMNDMNDMGGDAETSAQPVETALPQDPPTEEDMAMVASEPEAVPETEPSGTISDLAPEVKTNRLPAVTDAPEDVTQPTDASTTTPAEDARPPLERFAAEFENPEAKPLMAIVLIDDGTSKIGLDALRSFPYPLSFAVDAGWSGAGAAMTQYRAAGFEVLALANLPEGAEASDTEVAMQAYFNAVPEAVAVMEGVGAGLQSNREASTQLAQILLDSGHGLVMFAKGLNTAQKLIAREGVPAVTVFRDFDAKGQNATVIRRFLDQAAFKAGQEKPGVIMVGRLRADTISALLLWGLQDRAGSVALAPVSAVLRGE